MLGCKYTSFGCFVLACLLAAASSGCGECVGSADLSVDQLVPDGQQVNCEASETFEVGSREVTFTKVEYGEQRDCPSGCFSATLCAVEDGDEAHLFYASWNELAEKPATLDQECPNLPEGDMETWDECEPSGLTHLVTQTRAFAEFAEEEIGSGPFRLCVNRYDPARFGG